MRGTCPASSLSRRLGLGWCRSVGPPISPTNAHRVAFRPLFVTETHRFVVGRPIRSALAGWRRHHAIDRAISVAPVWLAGQTFARCRRLCGWPGGRSIFDWGAGRPETFGCALGGLSGPTAGGRGVTPNNGREHTGCCDQGGIDQKRRGHHDWLQGAGPAGGGRGGAVWPIGRTQESPGSGRLAVDLAPAASAADPRTRDGARLRSSAISRSLRANRTAGQNATVYPEGQPTVLVLDDSGGNRDRCRDFQPDDDRQRHRSPTLSLSRKGREEIRPGLNLPPRSWDVSLNRRIRP